MFEAVIFVGLQGAGKSSFYKNRFFNSHLRINLDMLRTRHRENLLVQACLDARQSFVVDNTNPTATERLRYISPAQTAGFKVVGYYFDVKVEEAIARNATRQGQEFIPLKGIYATAHRMQVPTVEEGFNEIFYVKPAGTEFVVTQIV